MVQGSYSTDMSKLKINNLENFKFEKYLRSISLLHVIICELNFQTNFTILSDEITSIHLFYYKLCIHFNFLMSTYIESVQEAELIVQEFKHIRSNNRKQIKVLSKKEHVKYTRIDFQLFITNTNLDCTVQK